MLELENISFTYPNSAEEIFRSLSMRIEDGSFVSIIGASGSGKTTLFRLLNGLETPSAGSIRLDGAPLSAGRSHAKSAALPTGNSSPGRSAALPTGNSSPGRSAALPTGNSSPGRSAALPTGNSSPERCSALPTGNTSPGHGSALPTGNTSPGHGALLPEKKSGSRHYAAYMPQQDLLFPWLTVEKNVMLPMKVQKKPKAECLRTAREMLARVGLADWGERYPRELSGGMRQRASFARTLCAGADLLLLDEPFSALDSITRISLQEWLLGQWNALQKTILFITHDVEEAIFLSRRVLVLTGHPVTNLREYDVPLPDVRTREMLLRPEIAALKERLIALLREEAGSGKDSLAGTDAFPQSETGIPEGSHGETGPAPKRRTGIPEGSHGETEPAPKRRTGIPEGSHGETGPAPKRRTGIPEQSHGEAGPAPKRKAGIPEDSHHGTGDRT